MRPSSPTDRPRSGLAKVCWTLGAALALTAAGASAESRAVPDDRPTAPCPGFEHPGGLTATGTSCVDICGVLADSPVERPPAVVCFETGDRECEAKTGAADFDYLLLSQHWLPTVCAGLAAGYDTTLTHRGGVRCGEAAPARLTVHGLWPNYRAGFPQCCGDPRPLVPARARQWPPQLVQRLTAEWPDPTTGFEGAVCELLNHEWQKHGTCMEEQSDGGAQRYFRTGLALADRLAAASATVAGWAGKTVAAERVAALYPRAVRLFCDAARPERLLEVHSCWDPELKMLDCSPAGGFGPLVPCGERVSLPAG